MIFCLLFTITLSGQEMTLEQCRKKAIENNKKISIAYKNKEKADLTVKSTFTNFLPKLSASGIAYYTSSKSDLALKLGSMQIFDPNLVSSIVPSQYYPIIEGLSVISLPDMNFRLNLNNTYLAGINLEQPIYMGGKIRAGYKMSKIGDEIADLNIKLTESEVIVETDKAYWTYVQTLELQKSAKTYKETVEEFYRVVNNAVETGMKSRNDLMKVQVQLNQANLQLQRAENGVRLSGMNLCQILGLPLLTDIMPSQSFNENILSVNSEIDITTRPEYEMLNKQIEFKVQEERVVRSDFLPSVGVRGAYNYTYGVKLNDDLLFDKGGFSAMVSVSIPLFHWGEGARKIKIAETERIITELQSYDLNEKMVLETQQAIDKYNELLLEVAMTKTALDQAQENLKMSKDYYEVGMESISDYLEAQAILQNAESEYIVAKTKLEIGKTEYLKAIGRLVVD
jgi:outer membrane protein TolC